MMAIWGLIASKILTSKLGGSGSNQNALKQQQALLEQQKRDEERRKQNTLIAVGISLLLVVGAILAYQTIQKGKTIKTVQR